MVNFINKNMVYQWVIVCLRYWQIYTSMTSPKNIDNNNNGRNYLDGIHQPDQQHRQTYQVHHRIRKEKPNQFPRHHDHSGLQLMSPKFDQEESH